MTDHVHKWSIEHQIIETDDGPPQPRGEVFAFCGCGEELRPDDIFRRVNAVEKLSAETAHAIWRKLDALSQEHLGYEFALNAYAAALEGENEKS